MKKIYKYLSMLLFLLTCSIFLSMPVKADGITTVQISGTRDYDIAKEICNIVNVERAQNGFSPVKLNMQLTEEAMKRAEELAVYYSHTRPSGESCWSASNIATAENIAIGYQSASDAMNVWMNSTGHRLNILAGNCNGIGVGVFTNGYRKYFVQMFTPYSTIAEETFVGKRQVTSTINILESNLNLILNCSNSNLQEGQEATLSLYNINKGFSYYSAELNTAGVTWNVSDPNVLSVNNGKVTAKKAGTATVSAVFGTKSVSVTITVQHAWNTNYTVIKEATCEEPGEKVLLCKICGAENPASKTTIPVKSHQWSSWTVTKEASCETDGQKKRSCSECGKSETETIAKTGIHKWGGWTVIKEATVLENGIRERICQECQRHDKESTKKVTPTGKLNMAKIYLKVNQVSKALKVTGMKQEDGIASYTSSNKKIFTVDKYGKITGKGKGSATLKVTLKSGKKLYAKVYVQTSTVKTTKLQVNKKVVTLKKGKTFTLKTAVAPLTSQQKVTFATTKKSVATVNKYGKITAKKQGTAYIVVRSGSKKVTVKVIVK